MIDQHKVPRFEFLPCLKVVSRKSAERILKRKASLSKGILKRTTAGIFVSRLLELSLKKKQTGANLRLFNIGSAV